MSKISGAVSDRKSPGSIASRGDDQSAAPSAHPGSPRSRVFVACPHCTTTLSVRSIYIGNPVRCKRCNQRLVVPASPDVQPTPIYEDSTDIPSTASHQSGFNLTTGARTGADGSLLNQVACFIAAHTELRSAHERLCAENLQLREELADVRATRATTIAELETIRSALGPIAPGDVPSLAAAREFLGEEVQTLRAENERLLGDHSGHILTISQLDAKVQELASLYEERDALVSQVTAHEREIVVARAECDSLSRSLDEERASLVEAKAETAQLKLLFDDMIAEHKHATAIQLETLSAELDGSRAALRSLDRTRQEEIENLVSRLTASNEQYEALRAEQRSAESLIASFRSANEELVAAQKQLVAGHREQLESEQLERAKLAAELSEFRAETHQMLEAAEELIAVALDVPTAPVASAEELDFQETPTERRLNADFIESDYLSRIMEDALKCGAVREDMIGRSPDGVAVEKRPVRNDDDSMCPTVAR
jgi:hypothetical protein